MKSIYGRYYSQAAYKLVQAFKTPAQFTKFLSNAILDAHVSDIKTGVTVTDRSHFSLNVMLQEIVPVWIEHARSRELNDKLSGALYECVNFLGAEGFEEVFYAITANYIQACKYHRSSFESQNAKFSSPASSFLAISSLLKRAEN
jgi:hypothetical protein